MHLNGIKKVDIGEGVHVEQCVAELAQHEVRATEVYRRHAYFTPSHPATFGYRWNQISF